MKLAANADKQQLQRIKAVFEKKNQKSANSIAQLQKKLDGYHKRIKNWEVCHSSLTIFVFDDIRYHFNILLFQQTHGSSSGQGTHRQPREMLRDMGQGLKYGFHFKLVSIQCEICSDDLSFTEMSEAT